MQDQVEGGGRREGVDLGHNKQRVEGNDVSYRTHNPLSPTWLSTVLLFLRPLVHDSPMQGCWRWWCYQHLGHRQTSPSGTQRFLCCMQTPLFDFAPCSHCLYTCIPCANTITQYISHFKLFLISSILQLDIPHQFKTQKFQFNVTNGFLHTHPLFRHSISLKLGNTNGWI